MSPIASCLPNLIGRFPRTRGDEPEGDRVIIAVNTFSPHTRG